MACGILHQFFGCPRMHLLSQLTFNSKTEGTKVGRTAVGVPSLEDNWGTYLGASFHSSGVNSLRARSALVLHEQTRLLF